MKIDIKICLEDIENLLKVMLVFYQRERFGLMVFKKIIPPDSFEFFSDVRNGETKIDHLGRDGTLGHSTKFGGSRILSKSQTSEFFDRLEPICSIGGGTR